jgi:3-oxoacyl-[acyl-carrier protein] reductase
MTDIQHDGRVALVTGASRGIGAAVARLLASRGMRVVVNYRSSREEADEVVASIRSAGGQAMPVQADVRDGSAVLGMVEQARAAMGDVEVLVRRTIRRYGALVRATRRALRTIRDEPDVAARYINALIPASA